MQKAFNPIQALSGRMFRKNRGRNLVAVLAILMTAMMFAALWTLTQSMSQNLVEMTFRQTGSDAEATIRGLTDAEADDLAAHPEVEALGRSIVLGLAENSGLKGRSVEIRWADDVYAAHAFSLPTTGRMPEAADEVALDTGTLKRLGVDAALGANVTLQWRQDLQDDAVTSSTFTLCGYWEGNQSSYASMAWVSRAYADRMTAGTPVTGVDGIRGLHMAQVHLVSNRGIGARMDRILADTGHTGLSYSVNLAYSDEMGSTALQENLPMYFGMAMVFLAGYLMIYNIFQISVTTDVQFYGQLKTLGMTARQLRRLVYSQAGRLCLMGIPAGLALGWGLGSVLVPQMLGQLEGGVSVSVSPVIFLGAALFAVLTVFISCRRPARIAGKVPPVEAMRMGGAAVDLKKGRRHGRASIIGLAWDNLWRNKRRTVTVICSLTLGLVLLSSFYAKDAAFDMEKYLADLTLADFELTDQTSADYYGGYNPQGTTLDSGLVEELESMDGVEETGHLYSHQFLWQMDSGTVGNIRDFYTEEMLSEWASYDPAGVEGYRRAVESGEGSAVVFGLDGIPLEAATEQRYILEGSFDPEAFASGAYLLAIAPAVEPGRDYPVLPVPSAGSQVTLEGKTYTIMAVIYPLIPVVEGASEAGAEPAMEIRFILPAAAFRENWPENTLRKLYLNLDDGHLQAAEALIEAYREEEDPGLPVTSRQSMAQQYEAETRSAAVMGNAVSIVIALVGLLNFVNSMATSIFSRRREFAVLQSIGMTKRQLVGMLAAEGLFYALLTLAASYLASALAVGVVVRALVTGGFTTFRFTLLPLAICTPALLAFALLVPRACFLGIERQSVVERLRME